MTNQKLFKERFLLHLKGEPTEEIRGWVKFACEKNNCSTLYNDITIKFNFRLTNTMGRAWGKFNKQGNLIELSEPLWFLQEKTEQRETVIHEACHIIVDYIARTNFRKRPKAHGKEWKKAMLNCGVEPKIYCNEETTKKIKNLKIAKKQQKFYAYCNCKQPHSITKNKKTRILKGSEYICINCNQNLVLNK